MAYGCKARSKLLLLLLAHRPRSEHRLTCKSNYYRRTSLPILPKWRGRRRMHRANPLILCNLYSLKCTSKPEWIAQVQSTATCTNMQKALMRASGGDLWKHRHSTAPAYQVVLSNMKNMFATQCKTMLIVSTILGVPHTYGRLIAVAVEQRVIPSFIWLWTSRRDNCSIWTGQEQL
jgi:hypothetical protein